MTQFFKILNSPRDTILQPKDHKNTLIFIHGLNESPATHLQIFTQHLKDVFANFRVVLPVAPLRYVTVMKKQAPSWFDIKFRNQKSFIVDFDEAFSSAEVFDSYEKYLKPIIEREYELLKVNNSNGKLIVGGFSQGCGMSLHCLYSSPKLISGVMGIAGYFFPVTKFDPNLQVPTRIIMGLSDQLRPWQFVQVTYKDKIPNNKIVLVQGMGHQINKDTMKQIEKYIKQVMIELPKL